MRGNRSRQPQPSLLPSWLRPALPIGLAMLGLAVVACEVDERTFQSKLYSCNPSAVDPACGTDDKGASMVCVPAYQLGGQNFCASSCDANYSDPDQGPICMAIGTESAAATPGAALTRCRPSEPEACGGTGLSCLRTDLRNDEGVCMTVSPCKTSAECRDPTRATCMADMLLDVYGEKAQFSGDQTYCLQTGCNSSGSACSPGESCLRKKISQAMHPPDICVPNCDANNNCPPNYFCIPGLYSKASPHICIPGLPGFRCKNKLDCLVGDCVESGSNFKYCSTPCTDDIDCARLDSDYDKFICSPEKGYCIGAMSFNAGLCVTNADCRGGEICGYMSANAKDGNCFLPCGEGGSCPTFSNVPHVCLPQGKPEAPPVCVPSGFGVGGSPTPCANNAQCLAGLSCVPIGNPAPYPGICSIPCSGDDVCKGNRFTANGFCQLFPMGSPLPGVCLPPVKDGGKCASNVQCESKSCNATSKTCDKSPGW